MFFLQKEIKKDKKKVVGFEGGGGGCTVGYLSLWPNWKGKKKQKQKTKKKTKKKRTAITRVKYLTCVVMYCKSNVYIDIL